MKYIFLPLAFLCILACSSCQRELDLPPAPIPTGKVTFWAEKSCNSGNKIVFSINNTTDTIKVFNASKPACGTSTNTFELAVGNYKWKAYCGSDTLSGSVDIVQGDCKSLNVTFPDPKGKVTFWAKKSCSSNGIVFSIDDITDSVTAFFAKEPQCDASGLKTFSLPAGEYKWRAYCESDTVTGTIKINKDQCTIVDLTFPEKPAVDPEYIRFKINGDTGTFRFPPDSVTDAIYYTNNTSIQIWSTYETPFGNWYGILFKGAASAEGEHTVLQMKLPGMVAGMSDTLKVNITHYGNVGDYIEGNLKGKIRDDFSNNIFDVEMEFRIRRKE